MSGWWLAIGVVVLAALALRRQDPAPSESTDTVSSDSPAEDNAAFLSAVPESPQGPSDWYSPRHLDAAQVRAANIIVEEALGADLNPAMMLALAVTESSLRPGIIGDDGKSIGLFQIQVATATDYVQGITQVDLLNPSLNAAAAMLFMNDLRRRWPGRTVADYAQAWALGGTGYFIKGRTYPVKVRAMERAIADLQLPISIEQVV